MPTVPPKGADLVLTSNIPDGERDVFVFDSLDVESWIMLEPRRVHRHHSLTDRRDSRHNLAELEFIKDGGLTSGIQTDLEVD
jgi:hypothetical protein